MVQRLKHVSIGWYNKNKGCVMTEKNKYNINGNPTMATA
jgi:hypothetical protein